MNQPEELTRWRRLRGRIRLEPWHALLLIPVVLNMWFMRHMLLNVSWPNDLPFHVSMAQWAADRFSAGQVPLDGWYSRLSGGYPQFHMYQSLPHLITGFVGQFIGVDRAVNLATYLLWCTWPVSVFIAARAFAMDKVASVMAAFCAPLLVSPVSYGYELGSYSWVGYGLWSQLWGMWLFPLALAWSARAVSDGKRMVRAVAAMALLVACHLPTAWYALLAVGLWLVVRPSEWRVRLPRVVAIGVGSIVAASWVVVPLITDQWAAMATTFETDNVFSDSYGWRKVMGWVITGDINDNGRWPVVTIAAGIGLVVAVASWFRRPIRWARELPLLFITGLVLFIGRNPFGRLIDWLPGSKLVFLHRYHIVIHLVSLMLAGVAISAVGRGLVGLVKAFEMLDGAEPSAARPAHRRASTIGAGFALSVLAALFVLIPAGANVRAAAANDRSWVLKQQTADLGVGRDASRLIALAHERGGGRIYGGRINNWGDQFRIGTAPMPIMLGHYPIDQIGYNLRVSGLSGDLETYLNDTEAAQLRLLGIKFFIAPRSQPVAAGLNLIAASGPYYLYEVPDSRWMEVVNVIGPTWKVRRDELGTQVLDALGSVALQGFDRRLMSLDGHSGDASTTEVAGSGAPGRILDSEADPPAGHFDAEVQMSRAGAVIAKTNWHPRWRVTVDGKPASTFMVTPMQLAVEVPEGRHTVSFRYTAYSLHWLWFALGTLVLFGLSRWGRVERRLARLDREWGGEEPPWPENQTSLPPQLAGIDYEKPSLQEEPGELP